MDVLADDDAPDGAEDPGTPAVEEPKLLWRSRTDRYLGGVAGGVAERIGTDPIFLRLALVVAVIFIQRGGGDGAHVLVILGYCLAWLVLPPRNERALILRLREKSALQEAAGACCLGVVAVALLESPQMVVVLGLLAGAAALLSDGRRSNDVLQTKPAPAGESPTRDTFARSPDFDSDLDPAPLEPNERAPRSDAGNPLAFVERVRDRIATREAVAPLQRRRREPPLWPLTIALLVLGSLVFLLVDYNIDPGLDPRIWVNGALATIAGVLLLSAWKGRARWTAVLALPLLPLWLVGSVTGIGRFDGQGSTSRAPVVVPESGVLSYELGYGEMNIDLSRLDLKDGSRTHVELNMTGGLLAVEVPDDVRVEVIGVVGLAEVRFREHYSYGSETLFDYELNRAYEVDEIPCTATVIDRAELPWLAARAGIEVNGSSDPADLLEEAGFPPPVVTERDDLWIEGPGVDRNGEPRWLEVSMNNYGELCRSTIPAPENPPTVVVQPTLGVGELEIRRG